MIIYLRITKGLCALITHIDYFVSLYLMISISLLAFVIVYLHHFIHIWVVDEDNHSNIQVKTNKWSCLLFFFFTVGKELRLKMFCQAPAMSAQHDSYTGDDNKNEYYDDIALLYVVISRLFLFVFTCMLLWLSSSTTQIWIKWWT
jgi:hypothetical protein